MTDVICIAAVGRSGQIGLDGKLPWPREKGDLAWFREQTMGGVLIMGRRTGASLPKSIDLLGRILYTDHRETHEAEDHPEAILNRIIHWHPGRAVYVCGGAMIYRAWAPYVTRMMITRVDYDGPADTWFPWDAYGAIDVPPRRSGMEHGA